MADADSAITSDQTVVDAPQPAPSVPDNSQIADVPASPSEPNQPSATLPDITAESPPPAEPPQESQPIEAPPQNPEPTTPDPQPMPAPEPSQPASPPPAPDSVQAPPPEPASIQAPAPTEPPEPIPQLSPIIPQSSDNDIVNSLTDEQLKMAVALYAKKNQKVLSRKGVEARQAVAQKLLQTSWRSLLHIARRTTGRLHGH